MTRLTTTDMHTEPVTDRISTPPAVREKATPPPRRWASSGKTRAAILAAARELFIEVGYDQTSIEDIVARSGVSVGSIYHHIGGKAAVFREVTAEGLAEQSEASRAAIAAARRDGETDTFQLYLAGAYAYMMSGWKNREFTRVLLGNDRPPGLDELDSALGARMTSGARNLVIGDPPTPDASGAAVLALLRAGSEQLVTVTSEQTAQAIAQYFIGLIEKLAS